jgi:hypothetical protein
LAGKDSAGHGIAAQSVEPRGIHTRTLPEDKKIPATYCRREVVTNRFFVLEAIVYAGADQAEPVSV